MSTEQQQSQTKPGIMPALSELDKPAATKTETTPAAAASTTPAAASITPATAASSTAPAEDPIEKARKEAAEATAAAAAKADDKKPEGEEDADGGEEEEYDPIEIWDTVSKLRGEEMEWKFPSEIQPDSPEAIHYAMGVIEDKAIDKFEQHLQKAYPRAYSYLLHISNGGADEAFFETKTEPLPDLEAIKTSVDSQRAFYKRSLQRRGIEEDHADLIIKDAIDKNKLFSLVENEHKEMKTLQENQMKQLMEMDRRNQEKEQKDIASFGKSLQEHILENKNLNITIPDAKRGEFLQFVNSLVHYDKGSSKFYISQEMSKDNLSLVLEALYYMNVKGNMSEIISKKANTENAKRLRIKMQKDKKEGSSTNSGQQSSGGNKPGVMPAMSEL